MKQNKLINLSKVTYSSLSGRIGMQWQNWYSNLDLSPKLTFHYAMLPLQRMFIFLAYNYLNQILHNLPLFFMDPGRQCLCMTTEYMYLFTHKTLNMAYYAPRPTEINKTISI